MTNFLGMDEVGRGALAGPVVTAAVLFSRNYIIGDRSLPVRIDDSKKLTESQRRASSEWIYENALCFGIGKGSVALINKRGIVKATNMAFRKAFKAAKGGLKEPLDVVYIDAFYVPRLPGVLKSQQRAIVRGDQKEFCIAAASIIAKVYRDTLMERIGSKSQYKHYLWGQNKGYGTRAHQAAIREHGTTNLHRSLFVRNILNEAL